MRPYLSRFVLALVLAVALSAPTIGQAPAAPAAGPPRMADGKPDLRGVWKAPYVPDMTATARDQRGLRELPFTPEAQASFSAYDPATGDYTGSCFPYGLMRSINAPYPIQIMQEERQLAFLFELNTWHHVVQVTRDYPKIMADNPTWFGYSIAHWEGDTLVVDTRGFNGYTRLDTIGHPHSDALHLTQTFNRLDARTLAYTVTVEDPRTYTKPWTNERTWRLMDEPLLEYSCEENNRSLLEGRIKFWTPPWMQKK